jgi:hypothetical protein
LTEGKGLLIGTVVSGARRRDMKQLADLLYAALAP